MKKNGLFCLLVVVAATWAAGCSTVDKALLDRTDTVTPRVTTQVVTNYVVQSVAVPGFLTNGTEVVPVTTKVFQTNFVVQSVSVTNEVTNTVYAAKAGIVNAAQTAETINALANPTPSAPLVNWGIEAALAGLAGYSLLRNKQYAAAAQAMVQGVEDATKAAPALAPVKEAIASRALDNGVADLVADLVAKNT